MPTRSPEFTGTFVPTLNARKDPISAILGVLSNARSPARLNIVVVYCSHAGVSLEIAAIV